MYSGNHASLSFMEIDHAFISVPCGYSSPSTDSGLPRKSVSRLINWLDMTLTVMIGHKTPNFNSEVSKYLGYYDNCT